MLSLLGKKKTLCTFLFPSLREIFFELSVFPGGCDWSVCVLFKEACKKAGLFTVPSKYRLSRDRKYHRPEAQQHTASANMQPLPPPPPPPPPHGWTEAPAKQPSRLSENYAPLPSAAHSPEWRTYAAGFSPRHHVLSRFLPVLLCLQPPLLPSDCLSSPVQHAWVAAWRWRS